MQKLIASKIFEIAKGIFLLLVFCFAFSHISISQVPTVVLEGEPISDFILFHSEKIVDATVLPHVDIAAALAEDSAKGVEIPRFGVKIPTTISENDGDVEEFGNFIIWKKSFFSRNAKSLNFEFTELNLPDGAQMYVYNSSETMVAGPIENKHIFDGQYSTDVISGDEVVIEVILPKETFDAFTITIENVVHGFQQINGYVDNEVQDRGYNDSGACNVDVNCPAGAGWGNQRDAVAVVFVGNIASCSGALINNSCEDLDAFFLTAFHCLGGASGFLNWTFRFNYDSPDPVLPNCRGSEPRSWITYSGANLRSGWANSDFALLELTGSVIGQPTIALAGWNRSTIAAISGASIHHPSGDVKKISTYATTPLRVDNSPNVPGSLHWRVTWATGVTEGGSSGSPLFDQSNRIIGDLSGGPSACGAEVLEDYYGRFDDSWTGGGTAPTRLVDWLGTAPITTAAINTIRSPSITGTSPICTVNKTFALTNIVPGRTATWAVSPTALFATGAGAATSGSGTSATLRAASSNVSGLATLTFTISAPTGCATIPVSIQIWVGIPNATIDGDDFLCNSQPGIAILDYGNSTRALQGISDVTWSFSGPLSSFASDPLKAKYRASSTQTGYGWINSSLTNTCGTSQLSMPFEVVSCNLRTNSSSISVSPNPSNGSVMLSLLEIVSSGEKQYKENVILDYEGEIIIFDKLGNIVHVESLKSEKQELNISFLRSDMYIIEVINGGNRSRSKLMIIR